MKKRIGLLLAALALTATALLSGPSQIEAACLKPDCFASPGCCLHQECDDWCGGPGLGFCSGAGEDEGGCCDCGA